MVASVKTGQVRHWMLRLSLIVLMGTGLGCSEEPLVSEEMTPVEEPVREKQAPPARLMMTSTGLVVARGSQVYQVDPERMILVESTNTNSMVTLDERPPDPSRSGASSRPMFPPTLLSTSHGLFVVRKGSLLQLDPITLELKDSLSLMKKKTEKEVSPETSKAGRKTAQAPILVGDDQGIYLFAGSSLRAINPQTLEVVVELKPGLKSDKKGGKGRAKKSASGSAALLSTSESVFLLEESTLLKLSRPDLVIEGRLELLSKENGSKEELDFPPDTGDLDELSMPPDQAQFGDRSARRSVHSEGRKNTLRWVEVESVDSVYRSAAALQGGQFESGQDADLVLSSLGFGRAGGSLLFNHPGGIASDGRALAVADRNNNRVLVWREAPVGNEAPDLVLGQRDFMSNRPGTGKSQMNWPISVEFAGERLLVADTYNHRVLVWDQLPARNGAPADMVIDGLSLSGRKTWVPGGGDVQVERFAWPWGLWSDGTRLALTSTATGQILIWNQFPSTGREKPELVLNSRQVGTPRSITSDGKTLMVGDHNARIGGKAGGHASGAWVWKSFPAVNTEPDFFIQSGEHSPIWLQGLITDDGAVLLADRKLKRWEEVPRGGSDEPDVLISGLEGHYRGGDGIDMVQVGSRVYMVDPNGNKILGFNRVPSSAQAAPDFVIGAESSSDDSLAAHFLQTNPEPDTDGRGLFSISSFDQTLYVWKKRPDQSAAAPDHVYHFGEQPKDLAVQGDRLVVAGLMHNIYVWDGLPFEGEGPSRAIHGRLGSIPLKGIESIAMDETYFYLLSREGVLNVWEGIPVDGQLPLVQVRTETGKLSTDGQTLIIAGKEIWSVPVSDLLAGSSLRRSSIWGLTGQNHSVVTVELADGGLFLADRNQNRVLYWKRMVEALGGGRPDAILGAENDRETQPEIGVDSLFWPNRLAYDDGYLWVGEYKFSGRLLRFSPQNTGRPAPPP